MNMRNLLLLSIILCCGIMAFSQSNPASQENMKEFVPSIIPPSPSVANLMKFEEIPVNNYTGVPDITIPLATIPTSITDLPVNVSLKYHTYNAKSDSKAGEVGLGWTLIAGGSISRTVRGGIDEAVVGLGPGKGIQVGMYFDEHTSNYADQKNYFHTIVENTITTPPLNTQKHVFEAYFKSKYDTQYDLYQYNFGTHTGRFVIKKSGNQLNVIKLDKNNLKIKVNFSNVVTNLVAYEPQSFEITDDKGNIFIFDVLEKSSTSNFSHSTGILSSMSTNANGINREFNSAFHLSKIKNNAQSDIAYFKYDTNTLDVFFVESSYYYNSYMYPIDPNGFGVDANKLMLPKLTESHTNTIHSKIRKLNEIDIIGRGKVSFSYQSGRSDTNYHANAAPPILKSVIISDNNNNFQNKYELTHSYKQNGAYKRLFLDKIEKKVAQGSSLVLVSKQDLKYHEPMFLVTPHTGIDTFFNCNNADCTSIEVLKSITYPTNGQVEFNYEANTYSYEPDVVNWSPNVVEITNFDENYLNWDNVDGNVSFDRFDSNIKKFAFTLINPATVNVSNSTSSIDQHGWQLNVFKKVGTTYSMVSTYGTGMLAQNDPYPVEHSFQLQAGNYYFSLTSVNMGTNHLRFGANFHFSYRVRNNNNYKYLFDNRGIRIKNIKYYDIPNTSNHPFNIVGLIKQKNYDYRDLTDTKKSSGALVSPRPVFTYDDYYSTKLKVSDHVYADFSNHIRRSSTRNFVQTQKTKGSDVGYKFVTVRETDKGKTVYEYTSPIDKPNPDLPSNLAPFTGSSNHDHLRGNLLNSKIFDETGSLISESKYQYNYWNADVNTGVVIHPTSSTGFFYLYGGEHFNHEAYLNWRQSNSNGILFDFGGNLSFETTKEYFGTANMIKEEKNEYFGTPNPVKTIVSNVYNSRDYLTERKTTNATEEIQQISYKYAHEKLNQKMIDANAIGILLETVTTKRRDSLDAGKVISKIETVYPDQSNFPTPQAGSLLVPLKVLSHDLQNPISPSEEIYYNQYDEKGNILSYSTKSGSYTTIIWGYNKTQPIVKVEGLFNPSVGNIDSLLTSAINLSNSDAQLGTDTSEQTLIDALDLLRQEVEANPSRNNCQITTYTYDPLIGVRSITPPSGIREVYIYDTANRLKEIREQSKTGRILKEFKYNYKQ